MKTIYKKIAISMSVLICIVICIAVANANNMTSILNDTDKEITEALEASTMLDDMYNNVTINDDGDDETNNTHKFALFSRNNEATYDVNEAVTLYHINNIDNISSLHENTPTEYQYIVPVKKDNEITALATLKKGKSVQELQSNIDNINLPDEEKAKIINTIASREGKWYVASIEEMNEENPNLLVFNTRDLQSRLNENNIDKVIDYKYVYIDDINIKCIAVSTNEGNYVVPLDITSIEGKPIDARVYTIADFQQTMDLSIEE